MNDILSKIGNGIQSLSINEIKEKHQLAINKEIVQYKTSLANLKILDENRISINHNSIAADMNITKKAYDDILSIGLFNNNIKNTFQKILKDKNKTIKLLNKFRKELIANQGDIPLIIIGDKENQQIINIIQDKKGFEIINNHDFLKNTYSIINKYNLTVIDFNIDKIGQIAINTIIDDAKLISIKNLDSKLGIPENETFHRGLHFSSKIGNYKIIPTTVRILCSNQITLSQIADTISFNNLKMNATAKLHRQLEKLSYNNFVPLSFSKQVKKAFATPASLNEFDYITSAMLNYSLLEQKDLDNYINYSEIKNTFEAYQIKKDIVLNKYMKTQIPINKTVWELINAMTYMASNAPESIISNNQREILKIESGKMLRGDSKNGLYDLQLKFDTPFMKKWY